MTARLIAKVFGAPTVAAVAVLALGGVLVADAASVLTGVWTPIGPETGTVVSLARDPADPGAVFAGTHFGGLYRSGNAGISWTPIATEFSNAVVFDIEVLPTNPRTLYVGTLGRGVFRSDDGGTTWVGLLQGLVDLTVRDVAVDPFDQRVVLAGTFSGVHRSEDRGASWTLAQSGEPFLPGVRVVFDPVHPGVAYAGTQGLGVFRSDDGGRSWRAFSGGLGRRDIRWLLFDPDNPSVLYAAATDGVFRLVAGAEPWEDLTFDLSREARVAQVTRIAGKAGLVAATERGVYQLETLPDPGSGQATGSTWRLWINRQARLVVADPTGFIVHVAGLFGTFEATVDDGVTLHRATRGMQNLFVGALAAVDVGPETAVYAGTGVDVRVTAPSFNPGGDPVWGTLIDMGGAIFALTPHPSNPAILFMGSEGLGVKRTQDYGQTWSDLSVGLTPPGVSAIDQDRKGNGALYVGTSAGVYVSRDEGRSWEHRFQQQNPRPVSTVEADLVVAGLVYYGTTDGQVFRSKDEGASFAPTWRAPDGDGIVQIASAPFFEVYAVGSSGALYVSTDFGFTFFRRGESDIQHRVLTAAVNETRPWITYVGTEFGGVYKSETNGLEWSPKNQGIGTPLIASLAIDPSNDSVVYAGSDGRVYKSFDAAESWTAYSTGLPGGLVTAIAIDPLNPSRLLAGVGAAPADSAGEGLYESVDGGQTWRRLEVPFESAGAIYLSVRSAGLLLAGSEIQGVFRSDDGGATWLPSSDGMTLIVLAVAVDPSNPAVLYAGAATGGVFKSEDGGQSWANVGLHRDVVFHVAVDPSDAQIVYAATSQGAARSVDGGRTWSGAGQRVPFTLEVVSDPRDRRVLYVAGVGGKVYRSDDAGLTWLPANGGLPRLNVNALVIDPGSGTLFAGLDGGGVYSSADAGKAWRRVSSGLIEGVQILDLALDPAGGDLYAGTNGGLLRSTDRGATWQRVDQGFTSTFVNRVAVQPTLLSRSIVLASVLNDPTMPLVNVSPLYMSADRGVTWQPIGHGLPPEGVLALAAANQAGGAIYAAAADGVRVSRDLGGTWSGAGNGLSGGRVFALLVNPSNPNIVYAGTDAGLFGSVDGARTWSKASTPGRLGSVQAGTLAAGVVGELYAGTFQHGMLFSRDGGVTWDGGLDVALTEMVPHMIAIDPSRPTVLYAALQSQGMAKSEDRGVTWRLINSGLGAQYMFTVTLDPTNFDTVYATSAEAGVWVSGDGGARWSSLNEGLFNRFVTSFAIDRRDPRIIYAGTEGGGVFRMAR